MSVVKLDAVESGLTCAPCSVCENVRQYFRQFSNVRKLRVVYPFAIAEPQRFQFAGVEYLLDEFVVSVEKKFADCLLVDSCPMRVARQLRQSLTVMPSDLKETQKVFRALRPPLYRKD